MLLAQINRDSQGMAEFHDADGQPVTLCLTEAVAVGGEMLIFSHLNGLTDELSIKDTDIFNFIH